MTDETLRSLQRKFEASGSEADERAWLVARVRAGESLDWEPYSRLAELDVEAAAGYLRSRVERGDLEQEKLELAVYCGHEPARVALPSPLTAGNSANIVRTSLQKDDWEPIATWCSALDKRWSRVVAGAGALAVARVALGVSREHNRGYFLAVHERIFGAFRAWIRCPCKIHEVACDDLVDVAGETWDAAPWAAPWEGRDAHHALLALSELPASENPGDSLRRLMTATRNSLVPNREDHNSYPFPITNSPAFFDAAAMVAQVFSEGITQFALQPDPGRPPL